MSAADDLLDTAGDEALVAAHLLLRLAISRLGRRRDGRSAMVQPPLQE